MVEWAIQTYALVQENGFWILRAHEEVNIPSSPARPRPRPVIWRPSSAMSYASLADRMEVDAALHVPSPEPLAPTVPSAPVGIKPQCIKKLLDVTEAHCLPRIQAKKELNSRVKKEEPLSPRVAQSSIMQSLSPPSSPTPLYFALSQAPYLSPASSPAPYHSPKSSPAAPS